MQTRVRTWAWALCLLGGLGVQLQGASEPRQYAWFGELIAFDRGMGTMTVSAPVQPHVFKYIDRFTEGDEVVLIWAPGEDDDTEAIRYLELREGSILTHGFVLPVEFVSADSTAQRLTLKTQVPAAAAAHLDAVEPGSWIRVVSPFRQEGETADIVSVESWGGSAADLAPQTAGVGRPIVTMRVRLPSGDEQELQAPESGLARLTLDSIEYAFRPTIRDSAPWNDVLITVFKMDPAVEELGQAETETGGTRVDLETTPPFGVAVASVRAHG